MGVQRKSVQVNWLASFGLIILAGTFYRVRKVNNKIFKTKMNDLMQKLGLMLGYNQKRSIVPLKQFKQKGKWEEVKIQSDQYRKIQKMYKYVQNLDYFSRK